ncbi:unnamed protein product [Linum tenue]|uniref:Protein ABIL1 n=1 Tax=Linum tenue TaxID=586396 RepID=A0AAV0PGL1_9ROSI|nr:unnamed protein product [Linum tenue]
MEGERPRSENPAMTFDEVSMERSKSFVKALQELKNLRPQLYSAAEYCEKSYLHSEQKQMVLDNLKDYAVRALVNAVDHLGTVAYKLTDLLDQQTLEVTTTGVKISCINQQLLTCQTYIEKEGLRQQQLLAIIPRHHKHYVLPNSVSKKVHFSPHVQADTRQNHFQARSRLQPSGMPMCLTCISCSSEESKSSGGSSAAFQLLDKDDSTVSKPSGTAYASSGIQPSSGGMQSFGVPRKEAVDGSKHLGGFRSFDNPRRDIVRTPVPFRSKSVLSAFFVKQKASRLSAGSVS